MAAIAPPFWPLQLVNVPPIIVSPPSVVTVAAIMAPLPAVLQLVRITPAKLRVYGDVTINSRIAPLPDVLVMVSNVLLPLKVSEEGGDEKIGEVEVMESKEESDIEQVPPERFTKNASREMEVKCDLVIDKVLEEVISDSAELKDEKLVLIIRRVPVLEVMRGFDGFPEVNVTVLISTVPVEDEVRNPPTKILIDNCLIVTENEPLLIVKM